MAANYLEQLLAEWYELEGYFLRRNVLVGKRAKGGHECELDIVGFHPITRCLIHVEPSMDALSWEKRERKYQKKFAAGKKYIHNLFTGLKLPKEIDHQAVLVFASPTTHKTLGGGRVIHISEILKDIFTKLKTRSIYKSTIPEHLTILRSFQFVIEFQEPIFDVLLSRHKQSIHQ
jgi:hypothetical protein